MYRVSRLDNGLTIASAEMPHMTSVSLGFWVAVGSRYEPAELNGVCHFIEHLLFKGTRKRSARQISEAVEGIGGSLNAFTSEEATCFHARAGHERVEDVFEVLADMLLEPRFAPADINKERAVIKEEIAMYLDEPQHQVHETLNAAMWPGQPLGRPITGTPKTLDGISRAKLLRFFQGHYAAGTILIAAAGRIKHRQVLRAASRFVRRCRSGERPALGPLQNGQLTSRIQLTTKKTDQTQLALGVRTCSRHDERRYALRLLNRILGENMGSRLFQIIREERGLAYSIYASPSFFEDTGDLVLSAGLDLGKLEKNLGLIIREIRRLIKSPVERGGVRRGGGVFVGARFI